MKKFIRFSFLTGVIIMLGACSHHNVQKYENENPPMDVRSFFTGPVKAWGLVQDRKGQVLNRFDIDMVGTWDGNTGVLDEKFEYYNGKEQTRVWTLTDHGNGKITGKADDIIGEATGQQSGNAFNFHYVMDIEVDGSTYRMTLDDWMWMMNDGVLINRTKIKKFGISFAELTIFMQKQPAE